MTLVPCTTCGAERVAPARATLQRQNKAPVTCLPCGEAAARSVRHTIVPLNKGHYFPCTDLSLLKQLNPKRTV